MEYVTTIDGPSREVDLRLRELISRHGRAGGLSAFAVALLLDATRGRGAAVGTIKRHECSHDEGIGDCSAAPSVEV